LYILALDEIIVKPQHI